MTTPAQPSPIGAAMLCLLMAGMQDLSLAADPFPSVQEIAAETALCCIDEEADRWLVLDPHGLKKVSIKSGEVTVILDRLAPPDEGTRGPAVPIACHPRFVAWQIQPRRGGRILTVARTEDGMQVAVVDVERVLRQLSISGMFCLADDGTYFIGTTGDRKKGQAIVRIDLAPSPRVTARYELGLSAHSLLAVGSAPGLVLAGTTEAFRRTKTRRFLVLDERLELAYSEPMAEPWGPAHAIDPQDPVVLLTLTNVQTAQWQVLRRTNGTYMTVSGGRGGGKSVTGSIAPDGKSIVMSLGPPPGMLMSPPRLAIWSVDTGELIGEYVTTLPVLNIAFSKSGHYLSIADQQRARLVDYRSLLERTESSIPRHESFSR